MYTLYQMHSSGNCYKIRLLMANLGLEYEKVEIDTLNGGTRSESFLKMNPNGKVPVLQIGERFLPESNAGLWYLAEGTSMIPADRFARAQMLQWMFFEQYSHEPYIATIRFWIALLKQPDTYRELIDKRRPLGYAALDVMEKHLAANDFFAGGDYSIGDIALYAYTHVAEEGDFDLTPYTHIRAWFKRVEAQPGYVSITQ